MKKQDLMKKATTFGVLSAVTIAVLYSSIIFIILFSIYIIISNYAYCTLPFQQECWNPDRVYRDDPVRDEEILSMSRQMNKVRSNLGEKGVASYNKYYDSIPVYDSSDILKKDSEKYYTSGEEKKTPATSTPTSMNITENTIVANSEGDGSTGGNLYKVTNVPSADDPVLRDTIRKVLGRDITVEGRKNKFIDNLDQHVDILISSSIEKGIDPRFVTAIIAQETWYGTSYGVHARNNTGGITCVHPKPEFNTTGCSNGYTHFASLDDSIRYKVDILKRLYVDEGRETVPQIGAKYAPVGASNDPNNLNRHWVPNVGRFLKSMGVTEDIGVPIQGIIDFGNPGSSGEAPFPDASKYKQMDVYRVQLPYDSTLYKNISAEDLKKNAKEKLKNAGFKEGAIDSALKKTVPATMNEAELHIRALIQMDMEATLNLDTLKYETAHAMLRAKREAGAPEKGEDNNKNVFKNSATNFNAHKKEFYKWAVDVGYSKEVKYSTMDEMTEKLLLTDEFQNKIQLLSQAAQDEIIYPFIVYELKKIPAENETTPEGLQKLYDNFVKDNEVSEQILSVLAIGHYMKRTGYEEFTEQYDDDMGVFSFREEAVEQAYKKYISEQREAALTKDYKEKVNKKYKSLGFFGKVGAQIQGLNDFPAAWMSSTYFDMKVKGNTFIRFSIYNKTRELVEIGSYSRNMCFLTEHYGKEDKDMVTQFMEDFGKEVDDLLPGNWFNKKGSYGDVDTIENFCIKVNKVAYGEGKLTWEESQVLDKVRINESVNFVCEPKPREVIQQLIEEEKRKREEEEAAKRAATGVGTSSSGTTPYRDTVNELFPPPIETPGYTVPTVRDGYGLVLGQFQGDEKSLSPRSPFKAEGVKNAELPDILKNRGSNAKDNEKWIISAKMLYKQLSDIYGESDGDVIFKQDGATVGKLSSSQGSLHAEWIDMDKNEKRTLDISEPIDCSELKDKEWGIPTHDEKAYSQRTVEAYYPSTYEAFSVAQRFNLSGLSGGGGSASSNPSNPGTPGDGGITGTPTGKVLSMEATAYGPDCAGCSGITAYGINVKEKPTPKVIAVDPNVIPLGTYVHVEGYGEAIAGDTGGAIKGNIIDVLYPSEAAANSWGRKHNVKVTILSGKPPGYGSGSGNTETTPTPSTGNPFGTKGKTTGYPNGVEWEKINHEKLIGDTDIHPTLAQRLIKLAEDKGKPFITITSGGRSRAEQEKLKREKPYLAATPGKSKHEAGLAVDISERWLLDMRDNELQAYGLHKPVMEKGEDWHIEVLETGTSVGNSNRDNDEVIQILGGLDPNVQIVNGGKVGSSSFKDASIEHFFSYTNVDYSMDKEWKKQVGEWLTDKTVVGAGGSGGGSGAGGDRVLDPVQYEGVTFQMPLEPNANGKLMVTSGFGNRGDFHAGIDFKGHIPQQTVLSATDGKVQAAGWGQGYGNRVRVMTKTAKGDTLYITYGHLSSIAVKEGQDVTRGQKLGNQGNTGQSSGEHLHFDVGFNGYNPDQRVNPAPILGLNASNTECQPTASNCPAK